MTRAIIIEDEPTGLQNLVNQLEKYCPEVEIIATGASNADLARIVDERENQIDVAFLDIQLLDGLVFQGLQQLDDVPFDIIFVTAYNEYALRAFDFSAIDYVLKPIEGDDLRRAVSRVRITQKSPPQTKARLEVMQQNYNPNSPNAFEKIGISGLEGTHFVRLRDIVRLEAEDNYTHFVLKNGERITASKTIKAYEEVMLRLNFVRVHKKHIVNMNFLKKYVKGEGGYLLLENGDNIEVSRRKKAAMLEAMRKGYGEL